eukprot:202726-Rhodomonas_salina.2
MPTLLILVRHALSTNNVLEEKLKEELGDKFKERYNQEKVIKTRFQLPALLQRKPATQPSPQLIT